MSMGDDAITTEKKPRLFVRRATCPLCGESVSKARERFVVLQLDEIVRVVECPKCGLVYKEYGPSEELIKTIYSDRYVHFSGDPVNGDSNSLERVKRMGKPNDLRHLDFGCGSGGLVRCAIKEGWNSFGVDPFLPRDLANQQGGRFFKVTADKLSTIGLGLFDWISMWAVIEHLDRPLDTFQSLSRCLAEHGKIIFNAPNADSCVATRKGTYWSIALLLEHTSFWTENSLRYVAARCGLKVICLKKCGSPYPFGTCQPSWKSWGLQMPVPFQEQCKPSGVVPNKSKSVLDVVSRTGQKIAKTKALGRFLRSLLNCAGTGDHFYVIMEKSGKFDKEVI